VYPKVDELPDEFRRRWDEHEARREAGPAPAEASGGEAPGRGPR
jgi:hypothetical protein